MIKRGLNIILKFFKEYPTLIGSIALMIYGLLFVRGFSSSYNFRTIAASLAPLAVLSCGVTLPVLNGGTDFSAASMVTLGSVLSAFLVVKTPLGDTVGGTYLAIFIILMLGLFIGMFNGMAVIALKMPSFIATMAMQMILQGSAVLFAYTHYEANSLNGLPKAFLALGGSSAYSILTPLIIMLAIILFTQWLLSRTIFGRQVYAVGTNQKASFISGIKIKRIIFILSAMSGIYAAISSILYTAKNEAGIPSLGDRLFIDVQASIVIGGTSVNGGNGGVHKTLIGVVFIVMMDNMLNLMNIPWYVITLVKGLIVLTLVMIGSSSIRLPKLIKRPPVEETVA
ncbi:MAG: ABC transporter permease [Oscillospiraceae bacterium]|nr:ABC transporter permease [Oscillospiraceae bacterium]